MGNRSASNQLLDKRGDREVSRKKDYTFWKNEPTNFEGESWKESTKGRESNPVKGSKGWEA